MRKIIAALRQMEHLKRFASSDALRRSNDIPRQIIRARKERQFMIEIVLGIGFVGLLAAFLVMWSYYDGQKKLTQKERDRRWDEISLRMTIENEKDAEIEELREFLSPFEKRGDFWYQTAEKMTLERDALQDRLSALLCPRNDHVWKDGVCTKCGKVQDA